MNDTPPKGRPRHGGLVIPILLSFKKTYPRKPRKGGGDVLPERFANIVRLLVFVQALNTFKTK